MVAKVPPPSSVNAGKGGIVFQDTLLLDDYEKKIAEFTKSWPKLSAFPGTLGSASSYFPGIYTILLIIRLIVDIIIKNCNG